MISPLFTPSRDLPFGRDASGRYLPWIIGFMVHLAVLALAAAMLLSSLGGGWRSDLAGKLSVQIMPGIDAAPDDSSTAKALELLSATPGVVAAEPLSDEHVSKLLEPWLGPGSAGQGLPMPRLIDVTLQPGFRIDAAALARDLARAAPGAVLDDHGVWLGRLLSISRAIEAIALSILALIVIAATATVAFTMRAGLAIHEEIIEVLHLVGAEDRYIAGQFQAHALRLALKGGIGGFVLGAATLTALGWIAGGIGGGLIPDLMLTIPQWLALACLPVAAAAIVTITAHLTVIRALARMA